MLYSGVYDSSDPWNGLLRNHVLVQVSNHCFKACGDSHLPLKTYKHIFTLPSSVDSEPKATQLGNACIHGMLCITCGSIAYITTQVYLLLYDYTCLYFYFWGLICPILIIILFSHGQDLWLWAFLQQPFGASLQSGRAKGDWGTLILVEPVSVFWNVTVLILPDMYTVI